MRMVADEVAALRYMPKHKLKLMFKRNYKPMRKLKLKLMLMRLMLLGRDGNNNMNMEMGQWPLCILVSQVSQCE